MNKIKRLYNFAQLYIHFLISTPTNYTCTNLADHIENVSHDTINDNLKDKKYTAKNLWEVAEELINNTSNSFLIVDDSIMDKSYSQKIELVKYQYSGNAHRLIKGIGIVNLIHANLGEYIPLNYRIYNPDADGKTKNDHFREMLECAFKNGIKALIILFDCWYAGAENLKFIHRHSKIFVTTLKENRLISLSQEGGYIHLSEINWTDKQLKYGITIKLKQVPLKCNFSRWLPKKVTLNG